MSGRNSYKKLRDRVRANPERRARVEEIGRSYDALLGLPALRESLGVTQGQVAENLGVSQPNVSKIERNRDFHISTLCGYVEALGGHLEVKAVFDDRAVDIAVPCNTQRSGHQQTPV